MDTVLPAVTATDVEPESTTSPPPPPLTYIQLQPPPPVPPPPPTTNVRTEETPVGTVQVFDPALAKVMTHLPFTTLTVVEPAEPTV
jgi:hypothetical protein